MIVTITLASSFSTSSSVGDSTLERVTYLHGVYSKILSFLKNLGASLPHVAPQRLLEYNHYRFFTKHVRGEDVPSHDDEPEFHRLSTQVWFDLVLQTIKVTILPQVSTQLHSKRGRCKMREHPFENFVNDHISREVTRDEFLSEPEAILLRWLRYHFDNTKGRLWGHDFTITKEISNFGQNLADGLVLAAVTAAYCPYLIENFKDLFVTSVSQEERLLNAAKIVHCWHLLNFSFEVVPSDIVEANSIQMLLLVMYLYEILPSMYPGEEIIFKAGLSQVTSNNVVLKNENSFDLSYSLIFFGNTDGCFSVDTTAIVLDPGQQSNFQIKFQAKHIKQSDTVLVVSGETRGYHYAKSKTMFLVGEVDVSHVTTNVTLPINLYKVISMSLSFKSPYPVECAYKLQVAHERPTDLASIEKLPYYHELTKLETLRIFIKEQSICFDSKGVLNLNVVVCATSTMDRTLWFYFRNKDVGDFGVEIHTVVKFWEVEEVIGMEIPRHYMWSVEKQETFEVLNVKIPCRNNVLWNALQEVVQRTAPEGEAEFWKKYARK